MTYFEPPAAAPLWSPLILAFNKSEIPPLTDSPASPSRLRDREDRDRGSAPKSDGRLHLTRACEEHIAEETRS